MASELGIASSHAVSYGAGCTMTEVKKYFPVMLGFSDSHGHKENAHTLKSKRSYAKLTPNMHDMLVGLDAELSVPVAW
jgi:hypothetical protein